MTDLDHLALAARVAGIELPSVVVPTDGYVSLEGRGLRLHYIDWGQPTPSALPLLFLHGGGLTCRTWDLVCLGLRDQYHCLALDLRGHGDSDWSPSADYGVDTIAQDVAGFVDEFGWERFGLVGMSLGGITALTYAASRVETLALMVIVDSGPGNGLPRAHNRVRDFMAGPGELDSVEAFVERALEFNPRRDPQLLRRSLLNNLRQTPSGTWAWKYDRAGLLQRDPRQMQEARSRLWPEVPRMRAPTLVVRGARSDMFSDEDAEQLASTLPDGRWVRVENAGHTVQGDNPRGLLEVMRPFLSQAAG